MRILLTNDDGVGSPGLLLLAKALRGAGHRVFVVAPHTERSGMSHSVTFFAQPCKIKQIEEDTWSCSGTPADCVVVALNGGFPQFAAGGGVDLVLSGINRGANLGTDVVYSGTAAAARQGSLMGLPSIAFSLVEAESAVGSGEGTQWHWEPAVSFVMEHLAQIKSYWREGAFVNVNFPNTAQGPLALAKALPCLRSYTDKIEPYTAPSGDVFCFARVGKSLSKESGGEGTDWEQVRKNNASLSVILSQPVAL